MKLSQIAIRCLFSYIFLLALLRLSGKKVVAEASTFDFVFALILGDMIDDMIFAEVYAAQFIAAMSALITVHALIEVGDYFSSKFYRLVNGTPAFVLRSGYPDSNEMRKELCPERDLEALLRICGFEPKKWGEIERGSLEKDGRLSTIRKDWAKPLQKKDL